MAHRLTKQAVTTYVPAVQEVIARPAYTTVAYERVPVTKYIGGTGTFAPVPVYGYLTDEKGRKRFGIVGFLPANPGKPTTTYIDSPVYTYHPAVVGVPGRDAQTLTDNQLGWNAGAQSQEVLTGDFVVRCLVDSESLGVLVGIQPAGRPPASFNDLDYAVLVARGQPPCAVEHGAVKSVGVPSAGVIEVTIARLDGVVTVGAGSAVRYTSVIPSSQDVVLSAVLYSGSDYVDDPQISALSALAAESDWGWNEGSAIPQLKAQSPWGWAGAGSVNDGYVRMSIDVGLQASEADYSSMIWVMSDPGLTSSGFNDVELSVAVMALPLELAAQAISIEVGSAYMSLGVSMRSGDYDYAEALLEMGGFDVFAYSGDDPAGYETVTEAAAIGDFYVVDPVMYASLLDSLRVGSSVGLLLQMDVELADHLGLIDESSVAMIVSALLENRIGLADSSTRSARDVFEYVSSKTGLSGLYDFTGNTYATNVATGAVARFAGFDFDGYCRVGMKTYGFRKDGLYLVNGSTDAGAFIGARVDFGSDDFGTAQGKRVGNIFMGLATDGEVYVRTIEDGDQQMVYRAYQRRHEFRADTQRGRPSRFWQLRLEVVEGSYAELDNIEWVLTQTGRRSN